MATINFNITQHDIDTAIECDPYGCPVARAIKRKIKAGDMISVGVKIVTIQAGIENKHIDLPDEVAQFIRKFDCGGRQSAKPFSFKLSLPKGVKLRANS